MHPGTRADRLASALDEFVRSSPDVEAAAVVSFDGLPMASALPDDLEEDRLGAMSAALLSLGEQAALGLGRGELNQIFVEGEHGFVFLMSARDQAVLTAIASRSAKIGFMLFEMRRAADRIGRALEGEESPVIAPEAAVADTSSFAAPSFEAPAPEAVAPQAPAPEASAPEAPAPYAPVAAPEGDIPLADLPPPPSFVQAPDHQPAPYHHVAHDLDHAPAPHEDQHHGFDGNGHDDNGHDDHGFGDQSNGDHGWADGPSYDHGADERSLFESHAGGPHHVAANSE